MGVLWGLGTSPESPLTSAMSPFSIAPSLSNYTLSNFPSTITVHTEQQLLLHNVPLSQSSELPQRVPHGMFSVGDSPVQPHDNANVLNTNTQHTLGGSLVHAQNASSAGYRRAHRVIQQHGDAAASIDVLEDRHSVVVNDLT